MVEVLTACTRPSPNAKLMTPPACLLFGSRYGTLAQLASQAVLVDPVAPFGHMPNCGRYRAWPQWLPYNSADPLDGLGADSAKKNVLLSPSVTAESFMPLPPVR